MIEGGRKKMRLTEDGVWRTGISVLERTASTSFIASIKSMIRKLLHKIITSPPPREKPPRPPRFILYAVNNEARHVTSRFRSPRSQNGAFVILDKPHLSMAPFDYRRAMRRKLNQCCTDSGRPRLQSLGSGPAQTVDRRWQAGAKAYGSARDGEARF